MWIVVMLAPLALVAPLHSAPSNGTITTPSVPITTTVRSVPQQTTGNTRKTPSEPKYPLKASNKPKEPSEFKQAITTTTTLGHKPTIRFKVAPTLVVTPKTKLSPETRTTDKSKASPHVKVGQISKPFPELKFQKSKFFEPLGAQKPEPLPKTETSKDRKTPKMPPQSMATVPAPSNRYAIQKIKPSPETRVTDKLTQKIFSETKVTQVTKSFPMPLEAKKPKSSAKLSEGRKAPPVQALMMGLGAAPQNDLESNQLSKGNEKNDQKDNKDYVESRRMFGPKAGRMKGKIDPALEVLLPNSELEVEDANTYPEERGQVELGQVENGQVERGQKERRPLEPRKVSSRRGLYPMKSLLQWPQHHTRIPQHLATLDPGFGQPRPPPPRPPLAASEHRKSYMPLTKSPAKEIKRKKQSKMQKLMKFIKGYKGLLHELIAEKRERSGLPPEGAGLLDALRAGLEGEGVAEGPVMRADNEPLRIEQIDLVHARGSAIAAMRLKGRICQRSVLKSEGPKYNARGISFAPSWNEKREGRKFSQTSRPKLVLPICCNCCAKSVLGCE